MVVLFFFLAACAAAVIFSFMPGIVGGMGDLWKPLLFFAGCFVAFHLLFLGVAALLTIRLDKYRPLEKQWKSCRILCEMAASIVCTYLGIRAHLRETEKLPAQGRFLFVCNHLSGFDPLVTIQLLKDRNIFFIMKPSILRFPLVGKVAFGAGCLAIDRENNREALKSINAAADYLRRDLVSVGIYPEGTRSKTGLLGDFHPGSFKIAQKAGVPVVVACISGTNNVKKALFFRKKDVYLDILRVIPASEVSEKRTVELAEYSRDLILRHQDAANAGERRE